MMSRFYVLAAPISAFLGFVPFLLCPSAWAVDGVLEISQAKAEANGGFPIIINTPGSYVLTSNLAVSDANFDAIQINANHVNLDLNGFHVSGPSTCSGTPGSIACSAGAGRGITSSSYEVSIVKGFVSGFSAGGISLGDESRIADLVAESNGGAGIQVGAVSRVEGSRSTLNAGAGIVTGTDSAVTGSTASFNNTHGLVLATGSGFSGNILNGNGSGSVSGGVELGPNLCDGDTVCP